jgi:hypothetical protein
MSRVNVATNFGESSRSRVVSTKLLASAHSCVHRLQLSFVGLSGVSNFLLLAGVGAGLVVSFLTGMIIDRSLGFASNERLGQMTSGFAGNMTLAVDFQ